LCTETSRVRERTDVSTGKSWAVFNTPPTSCAKRKKESESWRTKKFSTTRRCKLKTVNEIFTRFEETIDGLLGDLVAVFAATSLGRNY
jgi:hypothetical protein